MNLVTKSCNVPSGMEHGFGLFGVVIAACSALACGSDVTTVPAGTGGNASAGVTGAGGSSSSGASSSDAGTGGSSAGAGGAGDGGGSTGGTTATACFADDFVNPPSLGPNYDQFNPIVGSHCMGTNHQDIAGIERVVFLGDSVTVGTPPTLSGDYYRTQLAQALAEKFGLEKPGFEWQTVNVFDGTSLFKESGAFASCSKWGARTDDLASQTAACFGDGDFAKTTLVIMTMGGNDINAVTQDAIDGKTDAELWAVTEGFVDYMRDAVDWFYEPGRFPNGVHVVFSNMYEFTDGTGEVESCDVSGLAGFDEPVPAPDKLAEMVIWAEEQFIEIAVDSGADVIFMLEDFCGHGFNADNPDAPCYRGPGTDVWFDLTCIHPNPTGHDHITDMFMAVVNE